TCVVQNFGLMIPASNATLASTIPGPPRALVVIARLIRSNPRNPAKRPASDTETISRAIDCFDLALADVGLANDDVLRQVLHDYFAWATATTMSRYHQSADDVPNGLSTPHWSWDGLQV